jgi:hypothetical protein
MESDIVDRQKLTAYLLGTLPEGEQDKLAERYFVDDTLFEQLLEVELELIDMYVRDQLSAEDRLRLESYLNSLPDGWHKVTVARALVKVIDEERLDAQAETIRPAAALPVSKSVGLWQTLFGWLTQPVPAFVMATGLILFVGALIWLILRNQHLSQDKEQLLAQMQQREARQEQSLREVERKLSDEQARATQLQQELEREKQLREAQPPVPSPALSLPMISWPLSSTAVRDPSKPAETVRLNPRAKTVALVIPVKGKQNYTGYEVELKTEDGKQILWKDSQPHIPPIRSGQNIVFHRPASQFTEASYKLTLTLISDKETKTRDYYFAVVKQ